MKTILALLLLIVFSQFLTAQESVQPSSKPWWNPFGGSVVDESSETRKSSFFDGENKSESNSRWPKLSLPSLPSLKDAPSTGSLPAATSEKSPAKSKKPSALSRFGSASKRLWNDTIDFVNPFDNPKAKPANQGYRPQDMPPHEGSRRTGSWFGSRATSDEIRDVNGFLSQPRPKF